LLKVWQSLLKEEKRQKAPLIGFKVYAVQAPESAAKFQGAETKEQV